MFLNEKSEKTASKKEANEVKVDQKVLKNNWAVPLMDVDDKELERQAIEAQAAEEEARGFKKEGAYEVGDSQADTIEKDYKLKVEGLSDRNLAEMLTEYNLKDKSSGTEKYADEVEKTMKSVKSGRAGAETKLINYLGEHTKTDPKAAFKKFEEWERKDLKDDDLYGSKFEGGKQNWDKKTDFTPPSDEAKLEGAEGQEEEKGQVGKEASKKKADIMDLEKNNEPKMENSEMGVEPMVETPMEKPKEKVDEKITKKIDEKIEEKTEEIAEKVEEKVEEHAEEMEEKIEQKIEEKVDEAFSEHHEEHHPHDEKKEEVHEEKQEKDIEDLEEKHEKPFEDKKDDAKEEADKDEKKEDDGIDEKEDDHTDASKKSSVQKKGDYQGWKNYETWNVALWIDNDQGLQEMVREMAQSSKDIGQLSQSIKDLLEQEMPDLGASMWADLLNGAFSEVHWYEVAQHYEEDLGSTEEEPAPEVLPEGASKKVQVIKKAYHDEGYEKEFPETEPESPERLAESFVNGNISYVRGEIGNNLRLFNETLQVLEEGYPTSVESFRRLMTQASKKDIQKKLSNKEAVKKLAALKKVAEVDSPWTVEKSADGQEMIVRKVTVKKKSKDKKDIEGLDEIQK